MYSDYIKRINPKEGYYIEYFETQFPDIMDRARVILKDRTQDEIFSAAKIIDTITFQGSDITRPETLPPHFEIKTSDEGIEVPPPTPAQELAYYIERSDIKESARFPNASLEEYFAVLTLAIVGEAYDEQEGLKKVNQYNLDEQCWFSMGHYAVEAMESVAYAESLIMQKRAKQRAHQEEKGKRSRIAKTASDSSHKKTNTLLKMLEAFYLKNHYSNYSTAVHDFLSVTDEKYYRHLAQTNRERTLREALSKVIRGIRTLE